MSLRIRTLVMKSLAIGLLLYLPVPPAMAQLQFSTPTYYPVGNSPSGVAVGDFNGDGKQDLAVVNNADQTVSILLGNGDGTFQTAVSGALGTYPLSVVVGDFNKDGKLDLAVSDGLVVIILLGNGDGTFQPQVDYSAGTAVFNIYVADFNKDGKLDLLTTDNDDNSVSVLLGNGDGTFQPPITTSMQLPPPYSRLAVNISAIGDFNGDGKLDVVMPALIDNPYPRPPSAYVVVLLGNGDGTFHPLAPMYVAAGSISLAAGDFNGDGKADLAVASGYIIVTCIFCRPPKVTLYGRTDAFVSNGDGTFSPSWSTGTVVNFRATVALAADLNNDGKLDLIGADAGGSSFMTFIGNGDGTFQGPFSFYDPNPGSFYSALALGDFNADTLLDLAVTADDNGGSEVNVVPIFLNTTPSSALTITLTGNGSGVVTSEPAVMKCKNSCTGEFAPGTTATLTAIPNAASNFTGWSGPCSGRGSCTVIMKAASSVTATFALQDYSLMAGSSSLTLQPGGQGTDVLTVAGLNGSFNKAILLTCAVSGPPPQPSCALSAKSVAPGSNSVTSTLTITAPASAAAIQDLLKHQQNRQLYAIWFPFMFGFTVVAGSRKLQRRYWALCGMLLLLLLLQTACGTGGSNNISNGSNASGAGTPSTTSYTVTITGTSGVIQHTVQVGVTVQ